MANLTPEEVVKAIEGFTEAQKDKVNKALGSSKGSSLASSTSGMSEKQLAAQREYNKSLERTAQLVGNVSAAKEAQYNILEQELETNEQLQETLKNTGKSMKDLAEGMNIDLGEGNEKLQSQILAYQEIHKLQKGQKKFGNDQKKMLGDIAGAIGLNVRMEETFLGKVGAVSSGLLSQGEAQEQAMMALTANFNDIFNWQNITLSIFTKIAEATMMLVGQFDEARASLAIATGAGYEFQDVLFASQREANLLGVKMADAGKATATLFESTSNFVKASASAQKEMIKTTAMLEKLGIDGGTAAETFQFLNLNLGMTEIEATKVQKSLAMMGTSLGISSAKITKDFNNALPTLAVYGKQSVDVFSNLAAAAKAAGVETSALLGIAKQFDTFSGAAEGVAKMNALLGTQLSTTEMLMMKEDERIETLIEQIQMQGVAFGDMDKYTQMAIANAAGIQDINEAQKIFGMNLSDYKANKDAMDKNTDAQAKFEEAVQKTVPVMTQFMNLFTEIVTMVQPILETLGSAAESLTAILKDMDTGTKNVIFGITALATGIPALVMTMMTAGKAFFAWINWLRGTRTAAKELAETGADMSEDIAGSVENLSKGVGNSLSNMGKGIGNFLKNMITKIGGAFSSLGKAISGFIGKIVPTISSALVSIGGAIGSMIGAIGTGIATAIGAIDVAIKGTAGVGGLIFGAIVGIIAAGLATIIAMANAVSAIATATAKVYQEKRKMAQVNQGLAESSGKVVDNMAKIASSDFSGAISGMSALVKEAAKFDDLDLTARATLENLALISVGKAKDSMTGRVIKASKSNIVTNIQNIFKDMKLTVQIGENEFEGYVTEIAEKAANQ